MAYQSEIEKLEQRFGEKPEQWFAALADAYRKAGELDMALDILNSWIEKRPNYTSGHIVRGRCLLDREEDEEAAKAFQGVLELDPENIIAIKALSDIATRAGNAGQARHWLQRLLEVDPMNEEAHAALEELSKPAAVEPAELEPAPAAPAEELAEPAPAGPRPSGPEAQFDPMAIAHQMRDSERLEQVKEEATLEMEPAAEPEVTVEPAAEIEGLETSQVGAEADEGGVDAGGLEIEAFDEEMGWDAGERISHAITQEDLEEALQAHENSLDVAAHALPGIEAEEVPDVGVEERVTPAVEGLDVPPEAPEEGTEPVAGFEPTAEEVVEAGSAEPEAAAPSEPEPEEAERATAPRALAPVEAPQEEAPQEEEALPLILPDEVSAEEDEEDEEEAPREPEPVLTETMAQVYVAQGHLDEARDIYRKLLAQQPGNAALAAKVAEIESRAAAVPLAGAAPLEARFAAAATGRASVSVVLAEILGVEPLPAAAPPPRPAGAARPEPAAQRPAPPSAPPTAPAGEAEDFSFDEFFGGEEPGGGSGPSTRRAAGDEGSDDDFRSWLKSLKT